MIIGLAGTLNAGKDSLGNLLSEKYGFLHISTSDMIREMKKSEFGNGPEALLVRNDPYINKLRDERGPGFLVDSVYEEWQASKTKYPAGCIASAIRAIGEAEAVHKLGGKIIFVDANPNLRYQRSIARMRDSGDNKTFDEFMASERSEIDVDPNDKSIQNLIAMKQSADVIIDNNYDNIEDFLQASEHALKTAGIL